MSGRVFSTQLQVRFGHVDPAGVVYYPRIFDYVHDVFEELWEEHVGARYYAMLLERQLGFPLAHADVDFESPLRFGDRPLVHVTAFHVGKSSLGLRYRFEVERRRCLEARMTTVCVDRPTLKSRPMPEEFRRRFEEILEREPSEEPTP